MLPYPGDKAADVTCRLLPPMHRLLRAFRYVVEDSGLPMSRVWRQGLLVVLQALALLALVGCAMVTRNAVPSRSLAQSATLPDFKGVRFWGDEVPKDFAGELRRRLPSFKQTGYAAQRIDGRPLVQILALSGGGPNGAFGAGVLAGWTRRGDRPPFEVVTGVSAGAIIAPFAFLGARYDRRLKEIWTQYETTELVTTQVLPGLLGGTALADTAPLRALVEKYVDERMLAEIAREYRKGRILLIGTTNLDAQRPVVWNMGEIASSTAPEAIGLFRDIVMASAAIPGAFPPVNIKVLADGQAYDEMHVDGGTTRQVFVEPVLAPFRAFDSLYDKPPIRRFWIIANGKIGPQHEPVPPQTIPIAMKAIQTLLVNQNNGDLYRIYRMAQDADADFNLIAVPQSFTAKSNQAFDPQYQSALFDTGFRLGRAGTGWAKEPPLLRAQP